MHINVIVSVCWILFVSCLQATNGNNEKYEFVFGVPEVAVPDNPHVMISTASPDPIHATVSIPGTKFEVNKTFTRGSYVDISLPGSVYLRGTGVKNDKTVIVRAAGKVSVHVMANEGNSADGFLVLPTNQLGTDHYVLSYTPHSSYPSFICVSSSGRTTTVEIATKSGESYNIVLQQYQTYQLIGQTDEDLTGSRVISDYPVTVVAGTKCSNVGSGYCDALIELMPPMTMWGTRVTMSPFTDNGYKYRVIGTNVTTEAMISNKGTETLTEGRWYEGDVLGDTIVTIEAEHPVLVMQYMKGGGLSSTKADPSMIIAPSINIYTSKSVTFPVFEVTFYTYNYFIHVITDCRHVNGLKYDNSSTSTWERLTSADGEMCSICGDVTAGAVHTVSHGEGNAKFAVAVYGLGVKSSASYAYPAGIIETETTPLTETETASTESGTMLSTETSYQSSKLQQPEKTRLIGMNLTCDGTNMTVIVNKSALPFTHSSDVHLADPTCVASDYDGDWAILTTSYHLCQTEMAETPSHIVYHNTLILGSHDHISVTLPFQKNIECRIERHHMAETKLSSHIETLVSYGNFSFTLNMFPDVSYASAYQPNDYPVSVSIGDEIFLEGRVVTVSQLDLFIDSCWGTPTADPWENVTYDLVDKGCVARSDVVFHRNGTSTTKRMSFRAFAFQDLDPVIFIHCQMLVCDVRAPVSRCRQGCLRVNKRNVLRMRKSDSPLHTVSSGPLLVRQNRP